MHGEKIKVIVFYLFRNFLFTVIACHNLTACCMNPGLSHSQNN